jgi:hypothetical protein
VGHPTAPTPVTSQEPAPVHGVPARCLNCGGAIAGEFCSNCGQSARTKRLTLRSVWVSGVQQVWDLDHPVLNTLIGLTLHPGMVACEYVDGKRIKYVHPLKYCLICSAIQVIVIGLTPGALFGMDGSLTPADMPMQSAEMVIKLTKMSVE